MSALEQPPIYYVKQESYSILVPKGYKKEVPHGLFIWISAGANASIPKEWEKVLADKKLIFIGALNSGNPRNVFDRMRLAIDANHNLRGLYNVDGRRVYVSGFSGGSRVASMVSVCYADMFSGAVCFMGANFYKDVLAEVIKLNASAKTGVVAITCGAVVALKKVSDIDGVVERITAAPRIIRALREQKKKIPKAALAR